MIFSRLDLYCNLNLSTKHNPKTPFQALYSYKRFVWKAPTYVWKSKGVGVLLTVSSSGECPICLKAKSCWLASKVCFHVFFNQEGITYEICYMKYEIWKFYKMKIFVSTRRGSLTKSPSWGTIPIISGPFHFKLIWVTFFTL